MIGHINIKFMDSKNLKILLAVIVALCVGQASHAQEDREVELMRQAYGYSNNGEYQNAIDTWKSYLEYVQQRIGKDSENYLLGVIYIAENQILQQKPEEAESLLLSSTADVQGPLTVNTKLLFNETLAKCAIQLDKTGEAIVLYKSACEVLLESSEYYWEVNDGGIHWCWSDEYCRLALEWARLHRAREEYFDAQQVINNAFEQMRSDNDLCWTYNGEGLYYVCFQELMGIYNDMLNVSRFHDDFECSRTVYDVAIGTCDVFPELIANIAWDNVSYIITNLLSTDVEIATFYINAYIILKHLFWDDCFSDALFASREQYLSRKSFEYQKFGHLCQELEKYEIAEELYRKAKVFMEDNGLRKTEDYLNVLDDISYVLELKHRSN